MFEFNVNKFILLVLIRKYRVVGQDSRANIYYQGLIRKVDNFRFNCIINIPSVGKDYSKWLSYNSKSLPATQAVGKDHQGNIYYNGLIRQVVSSNSESIINIPRVSKEQSEWLLYKVNSFQTGRDSNYLVEKKFGASNLEMIVATRRLSRAKAVTYDPNLQWVVMKRLNRSLLAFDY